MSFIIIMHIHVIFYHQILINNYNDEITYLKKSSLPVDDHLLRGHLNISKRIITISNK